MARVLRCSTCSCSCLLLPFFSCEIECWLLFLDGTTILLPPACPPWTYHTACPPATSPPQLLCHLIDCLFYPPPRARKRMETKKNRIRSATRPPSPASLPSSSSTSCLTDGASSDLPCAAPTLCGKAPSFHHFLPPSLLSLSQPGLV